MKKQAYLIVDSSENNSDLFYRTGFTVPDPVIYIEHDGEKILVLNDLELGRGRSEASVDSVISLNEYRNRLSSSRKKKAGPAEIVDLIFGERKIKTAVVQKNFPVYLADKLKKYGVKIKVSNDHFLFPGRLKKTEKEISHIKKALSNTAQAMNLAISFIRDSKVKGGKLYYKGKVLTSEFIKQEVAVLLARKGYTASHTIVAGGVQGSMPHNTGHGHIKAGWPVVIDIFPKSQQNGYFGDMTRTVIKGKPPEELKKMYNTVLEGQELGISMIKHGVKSKDVHSAIVDLFESKGFETGEFDGKPQGFIHSTGHGLGLDIHEPPRVANNGEVLEAGNVVTVEPGLYYENMGGIRIEDVVLVTDEGNVNLTRCRKKFAV